MEGLFLSKAGPKKRVFVISDSNYRETNVGCINDFFICIRYAKHPLFGPALDKNKPSTTRPDQWFLFWTVLIVLSVHLFFEHHIYITSAKIKF